MSKKKVSLIVLIVALVICTVFGTSLAYLTRQTENRVNNFSFQTQALDAKLTEPEWDGVKYYDPEDGKTPIYDITPDGDPVYGYEDGDPNKPVTDKNSRHAGKRPRPDGTVYGDEAAQNMVPGKTVPKNPVITNTGNICDAWVSMKITFVYAQGSANAGKPLSATDLLNLMEIISINYDTGVSGAWERVEGTETSISQAFNYKKILNKASSDSDFAEGGKTTPLFTSVTVNQSATTAQIAAIEKIGGFAIFIEGFAAQSEVAANYKDYKTWAVTGVVFTNTPTNTNPADVSKPGIIPAA